MAWAAPANESASWHTVVIDPGHGGEDLGVKGLSGSTEKEVTLSIANKLAALVSDRLGLRVILTREQDTSLSWDKRVAIANNNKADLFISLHANSDFGNREQGLTVYVLTDKSWPASMPSAPAVAELVAWDLAQKDYWRKSLSLASAIQTQVLTKPEIKMRGVFSAPLLSQKGAAMPAVLIEVGFLSHPLEEEKLLKPEYQQLLAETIFNGILEFKRYVQK